MAWYPYTEGLAEAKTSGKPILLLVYADWCSKCRALAPVFERSDVQALLNQLVVVRQNQDEPAPWMSQLEGVQGTYVPRIVFLDKNGTPNTKVTSGHPRYPFFYPAENPESLLTSMKLALRI